jgi:hypothetical protein
MRALALAAVIVTCGAVAALAALHQPVSPTRGEKADRWAKHLKQEPMAAVKEKPQSPPFMDCTVFALVQGMPLGEDRSCVRVFSQIENYRHVKPWFGPRLSAQ